MSITKGRPSCSLDGLLALLGGLLSSSRPREAGERSDGFAWYSTESRRLMRLKFIAKDEHIAGGVDAKPDLIAGDPHDSDNDRVSQLDSLRLLPGQHEHE
jgi:hypothetical protein